MTKEKANVISVVALDTGRVTVPVKPRRNCTLLRRKRMGKIGLKKIKTRVKEGQDIRENNST